MKVNFDHQFVDNFGKPVKFGPNPAVFKDLAVSALLNPIGEKDPDSKEKIHRYDLSVRIQNFGSHAELNEDDVILLKAVMGNYHTLVVGPAMCLLDGKKVPEFHLESPKAN